MKEKYTYLFQCITVVSLLCGVVSCEKYRPAPFESYISEDFQSSGNEIPKQEVEKLPLMITYHLDSLETKAAVDSLRTKYSEKHLQFILALNRIDENRLKAGSQLIVPDTLTEDLLDYSPFPDNFEMLDSIPKTVLISRRIQGFALYEHGKLRRWGPVSSGKKSTPTPAGLFYGNYKAFRKISTVDESWIMPYYFNYMNFEGVGVHQYTMPGFPASHACVRLKKDDALFIYTWADQWKLDKTGQVILKNGTPFMVYGDYDFDAQFPWLDLADHPNSNFLTASEWGVLKDYILQYKKDSRNFDPPVLPFEEFAIPIKEDFETVQ